MWIETITLLDWQRFDNVTPHAGVWIETSTPVTPSSDDDSHTSRRCVDRNVRLRYAACSLSDVTPHAGVWIETFILCWQ